MKDVFDYVERRIDRKKLHHSLGLKKVSEGVFDDATLMSLYELSKRNALISLRGIVSSGKESNVYWGSSVNGDVAVKIYCVDACDFKRMGEHLKSDSRTGAGGSRRKIVCRWAHREFRNMSLIYGKVDCPKPMAVLNNVLVMGFIGAGGVPAPKLKDANISEPSGYLRGVVRNMKAMHSCGLVHGDLSEYNILDAGKPVIIDFSMGVELNHARAGELLERDAANVAKFFSKLGLKTKTGGILEKVTKADDGIRGSGGGVDET